MYTFYKSRLSFLHRKYRLLQGLVHSQGTLNCYQYTVESKGKTTSTTFAFPSMLHLLFHHTYYNYITVFDQGPLTTYRLWYRWIRVLHG